MEFRIEHDLPGRLRLRCPKGSFSQEQGYVIEALLETQPGVTGVKVSHRTGSLLIRYEGDGSVKETLLRTAEILDESYCDQIDGSLLRPEGTSLGSSLFSLFAGVAVRSVLPFNLRRIVAVCRALPLFRQGLASLRRRKLDVAVLDASAVGVSMLRQDFRTAGVITTLLTLGGVLESWTRQRSKESLVESLALNIDGLWVRREDGQIGRIAMSQLKLGDLVILQTGSVIPVDGQIVEGEAMVNQSAMTGEAEPVHRTPGLSVYAGTAIEEGALVVRVTAFDSETRIHRIAEMIDESEDLKAAIQSRAEKMADAVVPYSFLLAGAVWFLTGDAVRASASLMVDYSCALKLSTPLIILSAMREGAKRGVLIRGGRFLEELSEADTVVFDKTGTLTVSTPTVVKVIAFEGFSRNDVLRTAACLEEHFPHSIARAVVKQAEQEHLAHREEHSTVEYAVAHGIASRIPGSDGLPDEKILLGSAHFVLEDEGISCNAAQRAVIDEMMKLYSVLFLARGNRLAGLLCIEDPLRPDAAATVKELRAAGIRRIAMLTGDNPLVAKNIARKLGIDEVRARLLPEDKTEAIRDMKRSGNRVLMVGDGINDAPGLAAANVGVTLGEGADIAQAVADVVLTGNRLSGIIDARQLGQETMKKIYRNYSFIIGANSLLMILGLGGMISPALAALLHNLTTTASAVYGLAPVLDASSGEENHPARSPRSF